MSVDHILKCSFYNQGCKGGYPYLVAKFFKEFEVMPYECFDYNTGSCMNECKRRNETKGKLKLKVTDYYYVGGYYRATTEDQIY